MRPWALIRSTGYNGAYGFVLAEIVTGERPRGVHYYMTALFSSLVSPNL